MPLTKVKQAIAKSGVNRLAQTIAVPQSHPPQRLPSFPNAERTAVVSFMSTSTIGVPESTAMRVALVRSPTFPVWADKQYSTLQGSLTYSMWPASALVSASEGSVIFTFPLSLVDVLTYKASFTPANFDAQLVPFGVIDKTTWFYIPANMYPGVILDMSTPCSGGINVICEVIDDSVGDYTPYTYVFNVTGDSTKAWVDFGFAQQTNRWIRPASMSITTPISVDGVELLKFELGWSTSTSFTTPLPIGPITVFHPIESPPEWDTRLPYESVRSTAVSLLLSNVSRVLDKEGTVAGARLLTERSGMTNFSAGTFSKVNVRERYFGLLEKGAYCFTLPDAASDSFETYNTHATVGLKPFRIMGHNYYVGLVLTDIASDSATTLAATVVNHLEFRTDSELFRLGYYDGDLESFHRAQKALAQMGCIFENPTHLAVIKALVTKAIGYARPYLQPALAAGARAAGQKLLSSALTTFGSNMKQAGFKEPKVKPKPKPKAANQKRRGKKR